MGTDRALKMIREWTRSARWLARFNILCLVGLCAVSAVLLWDLRLDAARQSEITAHSLVEVLARDLARTISAYDLSMTHVVASLRRPEITALDPAVQRMVLFGQEQASTSLGKIVVLDSTGRATLSSQPLTAMFDCADCDYFRYFAAHADDRLRINPPSVSRLTGRRVIILSRRLVKADGSFAGVVSGAIPLDYLHGLFDAVGSEQGGVMSLLGSDGRIVMREPYDADAIGVSIADTPSFRRMSESASGSFIGAATTGTGDRHFTFTQVGDFPLHLVLSIASRDVFAGWWWKAVGLGAVVLSLSAVTIVLTWLFGRALAERERAESATAAINVELEKLAITDALTGLYNRRRFDEMLAREWRRAARTGKPLSLLILDADWFKGFNDQYGHQKGDEALRLIARAVESSIDPSTCAAFRIGGEEFAAILPDMAAPLAEVTANRIRACVMAWKTPYDTSAHGILTISVGVAQRQATDGSTVADLIAAADAALYQAKQRGRNRVARAGWEEPRFAVARRG